MSLRRFHSADDADWHPHPFASVVCVAGVTLLAWSAYDFARTAPGQGGLSPQAQPWRPATSKWSRAPTGSGPTLPTASTPVYAAARTLPVTVPARDEGK
jgi:hypothetical protein